MCLLCFFDLLKLFIPFLFFFSEYIFKLLHNILYIIIKVVKGPFVDKRSKRLQQLYCILFLIFMFFLLLLKLRFLQMNLLMELNFKIVCCCEMVVVLLLKLFVKGLLVCKF